MHTGEPVFCTLQVPDFSCLVPAGVKESILALISSIAARVSSSGLVLEVLGGVCTRFSAEQLSQSTKTVTQGDVMACFQAALLGSADVSSITYLCSEEG